MNFWNAPSRPRSWLTCLMALSTIFWAVDEVGAAAAMLVPPLASELRKPVIAVAEAAGRDRLRCRCEALSVSVTLEPRANVAPPPVMPKVLVPCRCSGRLLRSN